MSGLLESTRNFFFCADGFAGAKRVVLDRVLHPVRQNGMMSKCSTAELGLRRFRATPEEGLGERKNFADRCKPHLCGKTLAKFALRHNWPLAATKIGTRIAFIA